MEQNSLKRQTMDSSVKVHVKTYELKRDQARKIIVVQITTFYLNFKVINYSVFSNLHSFQLVNFDTKP